MTRWILPFLCAGALAGCTTLSDFEKMSPESRAIRVCANADSTKKLLKSCDNYAEAVKTHEINLQQGFISYHKCVWYEIPDGEESDCWRGNNGYVHCETRPKVRHEERCGDIIQPLDREAEEVELQNAKTALETCQQEIAILKMSCLNKAARLSADEAFAYFRENQRP